MAYTKHEFKSGEKLYAFELNEMEEQIAANEAANNENKEQIGQLSEEKAEGKPEASNRGRLQLSCKRDSTKVQKGRKVLRNNCRLNSVSFSGF